MKVVDPRERVLNLLERKPVDRAAFRESLWPETNTLWRDEGRFEFPDHSTPPDVDFDSFIYFRDRGLELATYK